MSVDIGDGEVILGCNEFAVLKRQSYSRLSGSRHFFFFFYGEGSVLNLNLYLFKQFCMQPNFKSIKAGEDFKVAESKVK